MSTQISIMHGPLSTGGKDKCFYDENLSELLRKTKAADHVRASPTKHRQIYQGKKFPLHFISWLLFYFPMKTWSVTIAILYHTIKKPTIAK